MRGTQGHPALLAARQAQPPDETSGRGVDLGHRVGDDRDVAGRPAPVQAPGDLAGRDPVPRAALLDERHRGEVGPEDDSKLDVDRVLGHRLHDDLLEDAVGVEDAGAVEPDRGIGHAIPSDLAT